MSRPTPSIEDFVDADTLGRLIRQARREDLGPGSLDVTSAAFLPPARASTARSCCREPGIICGTALLPAVVEAYDPSVDLRILLPDGAAAAPGDCLAEWSGPTGSILAIERVALNFLCHLSGVATLTGRFVRAVAGTAATILDTRKTLPGLRGLQKYAVVCGGGASHRRGLYDAVLLKDNHLAGLSGARLSAQVRAAVERLRSAAEPPAFIEIEVDDLAQLRCVLDTGVDRVLLDNMTCDRLREAVSLRRDAAPQVKLEASGGVSLDTARRIAETGVDFISAGSLTHSAPALDIGMDM